ncbi:MAG: dihydropteroate synthase [Elusimicrobia bacterium]|nr:dihydropteroate synthase [Elusimicrobiota bacterium]
MAKIVGILNITPDSFSDGGKFLDIKDALQHAENLISEGADIIDVGGESSRPGSISISEDEEINRVIPVIKAIKKNFPKIPVSIDTYKNKVAEKAIDEGVEIVNDIYGLRWSTDGGSGNEMADLIADKKVSVIIMHMLKNPQYMQQNPKYKNVVSEVYNFFKERVAFAKSRGIKEKKIILDPGIGFGKTLEHNLLLLKNLSKFKKFGLPIMVGPSRKSFIGGLLNVDIAERLEGTIAASISSLLNGAYYLRVHDVLSVKRAITVFEAINQIKGACKCS